MSELRKDIITREWVIIAKERAKRPHDFKKAGETNRPAKQYEEKCPFCRGNESLAPPMIHEAMGTGGWINRVIPNKFAALSNGKPTNRQPFLIYEKMDGVGAHEVLVESPVHNDILALMSVEQVACVLKSYKARYMDLMSRKDIVYVIIFKNYGKTAGASLEHGHSQIVAMPVIPERNWDEMQGINQYYDYKGHCPVCQMVETELAAKERMILDTANFVSVAPYASRMPYEVWIIPKAHSQTFAELDDGQIMDFASVLQKTLLSLYKVLDDPPFNYELHLSPGTGLMNEKFHWHLEITPRLTTIAGFELGTGVYINPGVPEEVADYLRKSL